MMTFDKRFNLRNDAQLFPYPSRQEFLQQNPQELCFIVSLQFVIDRVLGYCISPTIGSHAVLT